MEDHIFISTPSLQDWGGSLCWAWSHSAGSLSPSRTAASPHPGTWLHRACCWPSWTSALPGLTFPLHGPPFLPSHLLLSQLSWAFYASDAKDVMVSPECREGLPFQNHLQLPPVYIPGQKRPPCGGNVSSFQKPPRFPAIRTDSCPLLPSPTPPLRAFLSLAVASICPAHRGCPIPCGRLGFWGLLVDPLSSSKEEDPSVLL